MEYVGHGFVASVLGEPQPDSEEQRIAAEESRDAYQELLTDAGFGEITTEIAPLTEYFYAEPYHQQYLGKNPNGYCGIGGTGVSCSIGIL